jgi:hypothetical protein
MSEVPFGFETNLKPPAIAVIPMKACKAPKEYVSHRFLDFIV